jgi:hypothetical protein
MLLKEELMIYQMETLFYLKLEHGKLLKKLLELILDGLEKKEIITSKNNLLKNGQCKTKLVKDGSQ